MEKIHLSALCSNYRVKLNELKTVLWKTNSKTSLTKTKTTEEPFHMEGPDEGSHGQWRRTTAIHLTTNIKGEAARKLLHRRHQIPAPLTLVRSVTKTREMIWSTTPPPHTQKKTSRSPQPRQIGCILSADVSSKANSPPENIKIYRVQQFWEQSIQRAPMVTSEMVWLFSRISCLTLWTVLLHLPTKVREVHKGCNENCWVSLFLFNVTLPKNQTLKEIFKLTSLGCILIRVEKSKAQNVVTFQRPGWHLNFSIWFKKNVNIIWKEKDKVMK
jgi:hypothetical protein